MFFIDFLVVVRWYQCLINIGNMGSSEDYWEDVLMRK
jgi:hypothetical protein